MDIWRFDRLLLLLIALIVTLAVAQSMSWPTVQMIAGLGLLVVTAFAAFVAFVDAVLRRRLW